MTVIAPLLSISSLLAWLILWLARSQFWKTDQRLEDTRDERSAWPGVSIVIPARNEAGTLPLTLPTVLGQDYPGDFQVFLVDDQSEDGTGTVAREIAAREGLEGKLRVVSGTAPEEGWTGKLWALENGLRACRENGAEFLLFTDADIAYRPDQLRLLVNHALSRDLDLVSLMARLRTETFWERLLIPAFVYFFAMLYPFRRVNDAAERTSAAAGGCILLRRRALESAGGLAPISGELIDDCSLARRISAEGRPGGGRLWLGLTEDVRSLRPYDTLEEIWTMVARTAFVQLRYSWALLAATVLGMILVYLVPPLAALGGLAAAVGAGSAAARLTALVGLAGWAVMTRTYLPMVKFYRVPVWFAPLLPATAGLYTLMTVDSALRFFRGSGGRWKGRSYGRAPRG